MNRRSQILHSSKQIQKKRKRLIVISLVILFCIITILVCIIFFLRLPFLQISKIQTNVTYSDDIQGKINPIIDGDYLYFIPRSNILFYPKSEILSVLKDSINKIDSLTANVSNFNTLNININERVPTAVLCDGFNDEKVEEETCYFIDNTGFIFSKVSGTTTDDYFHYYTFHGDISSLENSYILEAKRFAELQSFVDNAKKENIKPQSILIGAEGEFEMYSKNTDDTDMIVYFDDRIPLEKTIANLVLFLENSKIAKNGATTTPLFESINMRFGNNIFYVTK